MTRVNHIPACGFRPLSNYVVVLLDSVPTETPGGIVLPEVAIRPATEGIVVATGPGLTRKNGVFVPISVRPGERVTVTGMAQTPLKDGEHDFVVMREPEILFVQEPVESA